MSFSYNPYKHIEIVEDGKELWSAYCHGCGAVLKGHDSGLTTLSVFIANVEAHLKSSHGEGINWWTTKEWSKF